MAPRGRESRPEHRERPDRTRSGAPTRGHEARQRGTPPATTTARGQVPSHNGHRVPRTLEARSTHEEPRHGTRCQGQPGPHARACRTTRTSETEHTPRRAISNSNYQNPKSAISSFSDQDCSCLNKRRNPQITIHSILLFLHCEYYSLSVAQAICDLRTLVCCLALHTCTPLLGPLHWGAYGRKATRGCSAQAHQWLRRPGPTKSFCMEF